MMSLAKMASKSAKFEALKPFYLLFRTGTRNDLHQNVSNESSCVTVPENILFASLRLSARKIYMLEQWRG